MSTLRTAFGVALVLVLLFVVLPTLWELIKFPYDLYRMSKEYQIGKKSWIRRIWSALLAEIR
jgi:hypothetical protein